MFFAIEIYHWNLDFKKPHGQNQNWTFIFVALEL